MLRLGAARFFCPQEDKDDSGKKKESADEEPKPTTKTVIMRVTPNDEMEAKKEDKIELLSRIHEVILQPLTRARLCLEFKFVQLATCMQIDLLVPYDLVIRPEDKSAWQVCLAATIYIVSDGEEVRRKNRWSHALPSRDATMEIDLRYPEPKAKDDKQRQRSKEAQEETNSSQEDTEADDDDEDEYESTARETESPVNEQENGSRENSALHSEDTVQSAAFQNFRSVGIPESEGALLQPAMCDALWHYLPVELKWKKWRLAYKVALHGVSFNTFFAQLENQGPSMLIVQDDTGAIFGGFAATSWEKIQDRYWGNGNSFVFRWNEKSEQKESTTPPLAYNILQEREDFQARFANDLKGQIPSKISLDVYREECKADYRRTDDLHRVDPKAVQSCTEALDFLDTSSAEEENNLEVYGWNEQGGFPFFQYFDGQSLAFGGGDRPAFYIEDEFIRGGSGASVTYANPMLSGVAEFNIQDSECWRFE